MPKGFGESQETTHYSIIDNDGNAVAVTYTLNGSFGAGVVADGTGILLNNEMDDFTQKPGVPNLYGLVQGEANAIEPKKTPLSSMSPTIVAKDGKPFMVIGSPGGSRIITITLEAIVNVVDHGMNIQEAIDAPRIHHQWLPDTVYIEPFGLSPDTEKLLAGMGYDLDRSPTGDLGSGGRHSGRRQEPGRDREGRRRPLQRRHRQPRRFRRGHRILGYSLELSDQRNGRRDPPASRRARNPGLERSRDSTLPANFPRGEIGSFAEGASGVQFSGSSLRGEEKCRRNDDQEARSR